MDNEQVEALLRAKYESGEVETGLFDAGVQYVVMDAVDDAEGGTRLTFTWFESIQSLDNPVSSRPPMPSAHAMACN